MKTTFIALPALLLVLASTCAHAQTPLPYYSAFDTPTQQQGWVIHRKGATGLYNWGLNTFTTYTAPNSVSHNYPVGGTQITDDWYVSPPFEFTAGGSLDSLRYYFSGFGLPAVQDTVAIYLLHGSANPTAATSKTLLFDFRGSNYQNDNTWRKLAPVAIPATAGSSYLAFRYKTVSNWLDVRFDNLQLSATATAAPAAVEADIAVYPNPAADELRVQLAEGLQGSDLTLRLYNVLGVPVLEQKLTGSHRVLLRQPQGAYLYQISDSRQQVLKAGKLLVE